MTGMALQLSLMQVLCNPLTHAYSGIHTYPLPSYADMGSLLMVYRTDDGSLSLANLVG